MSSTDTRLEEIKTRLEADKAEYDFAAGFDQSIRDRDYLLEVIEAQAPVRLFASGPTEYELYAGLAAVKAEEPATEWGTDYWGSILIEPSEQHARNLAQHPNTNVYSRSLEGEWEWFKA